MKVAIVTNQRIKNTKNILLKLEKEFKDNDLEYEILDIDKLKSGFDFVCAIGGDGTILKTARYYANYDTPILGLKSGRVGFLSQAGDYEISKIAKHIKNKTYIIQERIMLKSGKYTALNDFVIKGASCNRTTEFLLKINDKFVCDYVADGIIISTPTGSTAYGLSAGGPILSPNINCFSIVPICPHTLTARPLVIPSNEKILISSVDEPLNVAIDGQENSKEIYEFEVELSAKNALLAFCWDDDFYSTLRNKLHWGISPTNNIKL